MKSSIRYLNGYRLLYMPDHPESMTNECWQGYIYEHRYFAKLFLKRKIRDDESVHHLDGNRQNNRIENLLVLEQGQHSKLHVWLDSGAFIHESYERNGVNSGNSRHLEPTFCAICGICLQLKQINCCSERCSAIHRRKQERPSYEQLKIDIANSYYVAVGRKYGVSDNAIRKWIKLYETILSQAEDTSSEGAETTGEVKSS